MIFQLLFCVAPNEIQTVELDEEESFAESWTQEHKVKSISLQNSFFFFFKF